MGSRETVRAVLWQHMPGAFPDAAERCRVKELEPDVVILPEYHAVSPEASSPLPSFVHFDRNLDRLRRLAVELNAVVVGGTVIEKEGKDLFNTCFVYDRRITAGFYRKVHLTEREREAGLTPGSGYRVLEAGGLRLGVLVCADVLAQGAFEAVGAMAPDIIAVPTVSPYLPDDTASEKERRDRDIFHAGARTAGAFVLKVCAARSFVGRRLQGRTLAAAPWGILDRVPPDREDQEHIMVVDLPLARLRESRLMSAAPPA